jgi:hypothetical protein
VLRKLCGPIKEEIITGCRKLHNEDLHNAYPSPNIIRVNKARRKRWAIHVAHMRDEKCIHIFCWKSRREEILRFDGKIKSEWNLAKCGVKMWTGFIWLTVGTNGGLL